MFESLVDAAARTPLARSRRFVRAVPVEPGHPVEFVGPEVGGWWLPAEGLPEHAVCYSGGVGRHIEFDLALIERYDCLVHAFDPTPLAAQFVRRAAAGQEGFEFHPYGLWSADGQVTIFASRPGEENYSAANLYGEGHDLTVDCRSLASLMRELGHDRIDLLKLNVEGAEYEILEELIRNPLDVGVLCVAFHKNPGIRDMNRMVRRLMGSGFRPIHAHRFDVTFDGR